MIVYAYGARSADVWWKQIENKLTRFDNLTVIHLPGDNSERLAALAQRTMRLQCTVQEDTVWLGDGEQSVEVEPVVWKRG